MTPGKLIITLDFEIGWGVWETERWRVRQAKGVYRELRPALRSFIEFLDEREISLCWATVGAMIAPRRSGEFDHLPDAAQAHIARFLAEAEQPTIEGRDLFDMVTGARTTQQLASHSYSHTRFDYPGYDIEMQQADLQLARRTLTDAGAESEAFVFPENIITTFDAPAAAGHRVARTLPLRQRPTGLGQLDRMLERTLLSPPLASDCANPLGIAEQTGSMFFNWYGRTAGLRRHLVRHRAGKGLDRAISESGTLHLWLHPFNLTDSDGMQGELRSFLSKAAVLRDRGRLEFGTF